MDPIELALKFDQSAEPAGHLNCLNDIYCSRYKRNTKLTVIT